LKPWEFDEMEWGEYLAYSAGQKRMRAERWEQVRRISYTTASAMGGLEVSETEFMQLPYDGNEHENNNDTSQEEIDEYQKQLRELYGSS
jgi:hypothetical protein